MPPPFPPLKLAIVGGGPSSFYVASRLLSLLPPSDPRGAYVKVHIYDRLWAPHGLIRYGVAPDHPEVKNPTHKFDHTAKDWRFRFFGNVQVGPQSSSSIPHALQIPLALISDNYTHILFATGGTIPILHPILPPSQRVKTALSLVHWYTQHPSHHGPPPLDRISHVTLIGQGNVSLDVARILLSKAEDLEKYDVPEPVLDVLHRSTVKHVSIVGRRGPLQAAFTMKELREMMNLRDVSLVPIDPALLQTPADRTLTRQQSRTLALLQTGSSNKFGTTPKTWSLDFFRSPAALTYPTADTLKLTLNHTTLDVNERAVATGETSSLSTELIVTSLGHQSDPAQPFYSRVLGHLQTSSHRVVDRQGLPVKNVYASGWAAMGARGVLASTMMDAYGVVDTMIADNFPDADQTTMRNPPTPVAKYSVKRLTSGEHCYLAAIPREIARGVRKGLVIEYPQWKAIDEEEVRRGTLKGKERERMDWEEAQSFLASRRQQS